MDTDQIPGDFGLRLADFRAGARMKQINLADAVGLDASTVSRYEGGDLVPNLPDAQRLLEAVGTSEAKNYAEYLGQEWRSLRRPSYDHPERRALWIAEQALRRLADFRASEVSDAARAQAELLEAALKREAQYLEDRSHDVPFIGIIGVGKTTALSTAVGLMLAPKPEERKIRRTVLEVGAGNITICEVVVLHDPRRYGLIVRPQSEEEILLSVNELCAGVMSSRGAQSGLDGEPRGLPKEIDRALRNMCGMAKRQTRTADGKRITADPLLELAEGRNLETLASEVFKRLKLWQRTRTELWYDSAFGKEPADWLRRAFSDVNNGRAEDVGLPKQITVVAPLHVTGRDRYRLRVIDTKGIDEPLADRPDLRGYLEDPRAIPILCSGFTSAPDSSIEQLLKAIAETGAWPAASLRSTILVLPKNDEAFQVKQDESGDPPESCEEAYEIKADKVRDKLRKIGREGLPIFTYNSDTDDADQFGEFLLRRIEAMRETRVGRIEETARAVDNLEEAYKNTAIAKVYERVYQQLHPFRMSLRNLGPPSDRPYHRLLGAIRTLHQRTVWASVVRQGTWMNLDVYHYLGIGVGVDAQERCRRVFELEAALGHMLADDSFAAVHGLIKEALKSADYWREQFVQNATRLGRDAFRPSLGAAIRLWNDCVAEYGRGHGFRDRVADHLQRWFEDEAQGGVLQSIETTLAEQWLACFMSNLERLLASVQPATEQLYSV